jgi:hypothetical protein
MIVNGTEIHRRTVVNGSLFVVIATCWPVQAVADFSHIVKKHIERRHSQFEIRKEETGYGVKCNVNQEYCK